MSKGREFNKVSPALWRSKRFQALSTIGKVVLLYFLTSEHQNSAGCFRLPNAYAAADLGCTIEDYVAARSEVVGAGMARYDEDTSEVFVDRWFKHNPPMNDKHAIGTQRLIAEIESDRLREQAENEFTEVDEDRLTRASRASSLAATGYLNGAARRS